MVAHTLPNVAKLDVARPGIAAHGSAAWVAKAGVGLAHVSAELKGAERQLLEEGERALRHPSGKLLLVLHLCRLPAPRAHHVRVARVLLQDAAQRHGGQVFAMRNNDLVLLCGEAGADAATSPHAPEHLPHTLTRLFEGSAPDPARLISLWALDAEPDALHRYLADRSEPGHEVGAAGISRTQTLSLAALQEILSNAPLEGLLAQQTGISLTPDRDRSVAGRLAPAFQEVFFDLHRLNVAPLVAAVVADPFLSSHLAESLQMRLLRLLEADLGTRGRHLRAATRQGLPILIELGLRAIVSPAFATLSRLAEAAALRLWVAVAMPQAGSEPELFDHARRLLRLTGARLVLSRFETEAFGLVRPASLEADVAVLRWSPNLRAAIAVRGGLRELFHPSTPVVLAGVDSEHALTWGQAAGFEFFQGLFLDQVQAATRMQQCHSASACTVRQCWTRAAALAMPGRAGCANPALLAAGLGAPA